MAYSSPKIQRLRDDMIRVYHPEVIEPQTYLTADIAAGGTALTVANNDGWTYYDLELFEGFGIENAEIKRVNGAVTTGTSMTSSATTFAHSINCPLSRILFDQIEISGASSLTGVKADATLINITSAQPYTDYVLSTALQAYAYIFVRYYNSLALVPFYGDYSDGIATTDLTPKTLGFIKRNAFKNIGEAWGGRFTDEWFYDQIYLGELDVAKSLKRWSWLYSFDNDLGTLTQGLRKMALPADIEDKMTAKSIMGIRISGDINLEPIDWTQYQNITNGVNYTTLNTTANVGATSLVLVDSDDFSDSGSVNIAGTIYTYTANNRTTNTLSGLTALAAGITAGAEVWQNISFGTPLQFAVNNGYIYFDIPPNSDLEGRNVWLDYYTTVARKDSDGDEITVNDSNLMILWMEMAIKREKSNGELAITDPSWIAYEQKKKQLIQNEISGQHLYLVPRGVSRNRPFNWLR